MDGLKMDGQNLEGVGKLTQLKALEVELELELGVETELLLSSCRPILDLPALEILNLSILGTAVELFCLLPSSTNLTRLRIKGDIYASWQV